jgi:hypothetical protein
MMNQIFEYRRVEDRLRGKSLAGNGRAYYRENARADYRADPQRRERPRPQGFLEPVFGLFGVRDQLVNGLPGKKLAGQNGLL